MQPVSPALVSLVQFNLVWLWFGPNLFVFSPSFWVEAVNPALVSLVQFGLVHVWFGFVWFGLVQVGWNQFLGVSSKSRLGVPGAVCQWRARPAASRLYLIIDLDTGTRVKYCTPATSLASSQTATNSSLNWSICICILYLYLYFEFVFVSYNWSWHRVPVKYCTAAGIVSSLLSDILHKNTEIQKYTANQHRVQPLYR